MSVPTTATGAGRGGGTAVATITFTSHADVRRVLADARFDVPAVPPPSAGSLGIAWLRAHVSRYSRGGDHRRRRGLAVDELLRMAPAVLGQRAFERAGALLVEADQVGAVARMVPVGVLAEALGITDPVADDVANVARGYHPGTDAGPAGEHGVARLVETLGGTPDEATAARIALLVQAYDATAGLIENAARILRRRAHFSAPTGALVAETLRYDPPVRMMRRVSVAPAHVGPHRIAEGTPVQLDIAAANRDPEVFTDPDRFDPERPQQEMDLTFGAGVRPCPGRDHAFAIAVGVVGAARGRRP